MISGKRHEVLRGAPHFLFHLASYNPGWRCNLSPKDHRQRRVVAEGWPGAGTGSAVNYCKFARCDDPPSHQAIRKVVVKVFVKSDLGKGHLTRVPKTSQCSFLEGKSPAISQESRLVKYDSIGPDLIMMELIRIFFQIALQV